MLAQPGPVRVSPVLITFAFDGSHHKHAMTLFSGFVSNGMGAASAHGLLVPPRWVSSWGSKSEGYCLELKQGPLLYTIPLWQSALLLAVSLSSVYCKKAELMTQKKCSVPDARRHCYLYRNTSQEASSFCNEHTAVETVSAPG